jgi:DNA-binding NarL/FixJ family response regulator
MRILVANEHSLFRQAVRAGLEMQTDLEVVAEAGEGLGAVAEVKRTSPDLAILDLGLPDCDGVRAAMMIREAAPSCRVLILAAQADLRSLMEALEAGADGYLTKDRPLADLVDAVRALGRGESVVPPTMLGKLIDRLLHRRREQDDAFRRLAQLSRREREVLALLAAGCDNNAIAQTLIISPQTARTHIQNVLKKLRVHSRLEAAAFVRRNRLLDELTEPHDGRPRRAVEAANPGSLATTAGR